MVRSRRNIVICSLNDEEKKIFDRLVNEALKRFRGEISLKNKSERFRAVLRIMEAFLNEKAYETYWSNVEIG